MHLTLLLPGPQTPGGRHPPSPVTVPFSMPRSMPRAQRAPSTCLRNGYRILYSDSSKEVSGDGASEGEDEDTGRPETWEILMEAWAGGGLPVKSMQNRCKTRTRQLSRKQGGGMQDRKGDQQRPRWPTAGEAGLEKRSPFTGFLTTQGRIFSEEDETNETMAVFWVEW